MVIEQNQVTGLLYHDCISIVSVVSLFNNNCYLETKKYIYMNWFRNVIVNDIRNEMDYSFQCSTAMPCRLLELEKNRMHPLQKPQ